MTRRILVVEDDANIRNVLGEFLRLSGYETVLAENGAEGLAAARAATPNVVLLDLAMPVMDGFAFRRLQLADRVLSAVPTIVITASYTDVDDLAPLGNVVLMRKPLDFAVLLVNLGAAVGVA